MLLSNKNVIIYGAGGSIGGAVARAFAREGATVYLAGHSLDSLKKVADDITSSGGKAKADEVDAMDEKAIGDHINKVVKKAGKIDVSFNAIGWKDTQDILLTEMLLEDFARPVTIAMQTNFLTATAAARIMIKQKSGVVLSITATPGGVGYPKVGGFGPACCAMEGLSRDLASEVGPYGVRVVNIRSAGSPDSRPFKEVLTHDKEIFTVFIKKLENDTMLKKLPYLEDIANVAIFLASDLSSKITGVTIDVTCGTTTGMNNTMENIPFLKIKQ